MALIDQIKFDAGSDEVLVWKFPSEDLKLGSQLIVNQSQESIFVKGGQALDTFGPGTHTLSTGNIPLLNKIINLPFGGKTPFTAEVWFINKTVKRDLKWGTKSPIPLYDQQIGYSVNVRAFGCWGIRIQDSRSFVTQIVGSQIGASSEKVEDYFIGEIVQKLSQNISQFIANRQISILQINSMLNDISSLTQQNINNEFKRFGIEIVNFNIERINIPQEDMQAIQEAQKEKMRMKQMQDVNVSQAYTTMRQFDAIDKAASNEGAAGGMLAGGLGIGLGLGAGVPAGQQLGQAMNQQPNTQPAQNTPQQPPTANDPMQKLQKLKQMLDSGLITQEDFDSQKKTILDNM